MIVMREEERRRRSQAALAMVACSCETPPGGLNRTRDLCIYVIRWSASVSWVERLLLAYTPREQLYDEATFMKTLGLQRFVL